MPIAIRRGGDIVAGMCNLYSMDTGLDAVRSAVRQLGLGLATEPATGNFSGISKIYPDRDGVVIHADGICAQLSSMRWGFPPAPRKDKRSSRPITNIRNLSSGWWRNVNGEYIREPQYRCLVPFTRFAEPIQGRRNAWFAVPERELSFFAGIWRPWQGKRLAPVPDKARRQQTEGEWRLYAFLTTEPNKVVAPIHPKAMPAILTDPAECRAWLAGGEDSLALQRPLPDGQLAIVERDPG